ncbi:hypothetical protein C2E23DRAFT_859938 [Lenzites betulinus]|nr:hypothetical protein C2E23DRAFT_859938 [Lenzites betulinus]
MHFIAAPILLVLIAALCGSPAAALPAAANAAGIESGPVVDLKLWSDKGHVEIPSVVTTMIMLLSYPHCYEHSLTSGLALYIYMKSRYCYAHYYGRAYRRHPVGVQDKDVYKKGSIRHTSGSLVRAPSHSEEGKQTRSKRPRDHPKAAMFSVIRADAEVIGWIRRMWHV